MNFASMRLPNSFILLYLLSILPSLVFSDCEQDAQEVASGRGGPSLTPQEAIEDFSIYQDFSSNTYTSCKVQQDLYRSYRGALTSADTTKPPAGPCRLGPECKFTKVNSIQVSSCSELLDTRDSLVKGGYTALCRHELTDWTMKPQEDLYCKPSGQCTATEEFRMQRQLSTFGLRRSRVVGESLKDAGVVIDSLSSSPFERCRMTAEQVGAAQEITKDKVLVERGPLSSTSDFRDYEREFEYTSLDGQGSADVKKIVATRCRQWLQKDWLSKTENGNRIAYAHSSTIGSCLDISLDEGDCAWVKPGDSIYNNIEEDVKLSNHKFEKVMDVDAKRVELLAALSPEQMQKMGQCSLLREELKNPDILSDNDSNILTADSNKDLKITKEEFTNFCSSRNCAGSSAELWEIIKLMNARPYWKSQEERTEFFIGEHVYFNGGWRELKFSAGGWMFPWSKATLDTIRKSVSKTKEVLSPINYLVNNIDTIGIDEAKLIANCTPKTTKMETCAKELLSYRPVSTSAPADIPETVTHASGGSQPYPYETTVEIPDTPNPLFNLAKCLVERGYVTEKKMAEMMGCDVEECSEGFSVTPLFSLTLAMFAVYLMF